MLAIDVESYSEAGYVWDTEANRWTAPHGAASGRKGLPVVGANVYWEHPTAQVLVMRYRWTSWPANVTARWLPGEPPPPEVQAWIATGGVVEAHNAGFERLAFQHVLGPRHGFNVPAPHQWHCSAATARVNSYPASLVALGPALGLNTLKDADGKRLMNIFSMPRNPTKLDGRRRILPDDDPEQFARYDAYCATDVLTECAASDVMPPMTAAEREVWLYDQECNTRGIQIDRAAVRDCIAVMDQALERYGAECEALTGGLGPSQVQKLGGWLMGRGVTLRSLDAEAVDAALRRDDLPADVRRVLELRAAVGSASVKKLYAMELQTSRDNRLRDTSVHHGTRTGRNTGQGVQVLNLPKEGAKLVTCRSCGKPHKPAHTACPWCAAPGSPDARAEWNPESMVEPVLEVMRHRSLDLVEWYFGDALLTIQGCVRSLFTAAPGCELIVSDYSAIEAVVAACITGEQWRIDTFKARRDIYLESASKITGIPYDTYADHKAQTGNHHPDRQYKGKICELALGFQGWIGAWRAFDPAEASKHDAEIKDVILAWRAASPNIVTYWGGQQVWKEYAGRRSLVPELYGIEGAFIEAVQNPGLVTRPRVPSVCPGMAWPDDCSFQMRGGTVYMRLPSGRELAYHKAAVGPSDRRPGTLSISYWTDNSNPKYGALGWTCMPTWGGRIFENAVQAIACDILRHGVLACRDAGYPLVFSVYDEAVFEVPEGHGSVEEVERLLGTLPGWAAGWPIRATGGYRARRYRKDG